MYRQAISLKKSLLLFIASKTYSLRAHSLEIIFLLIWTTRNKGDERKSWWERSLFDKTFYSESKEKHIYQTIP